MSALSERLRQAQEQLGLSGREIARKAEQAGHVVDHSTVALYLNGRHGTPQERVLAALADVLRIPIAELRDLAGVGAGSGRPFQVPAEVERLGDREKRALEELIASMVDARKEVTSDGAPITQMPSRRRSAEVPDSAAARSPERPRRRTPRPRHDPPN